MTRYIVKIFMAHDQDGVEAWLNALPIGHKLEGLFINGDQYKMIVSYDKN